MTEADKEKFLPILGEVFSYYSQELTKARILFYWNALRDAITLEQFVEAVQAHTRHPENGKWLPKISDILQNAQGGTQDHALYAWHQLETAIRSVGHNYDVVFDDPLIHIIVDKLGGWQAMCDIPDEASLKFKAVEFKKHYASLYGKPIDLSHLPRLRGHINLANSVSKYGHLVAEKPPVLIGDQSKAQQNMALLVENKKRIAYLHDGSANNAQEAPSSTGAVAQTGQQLANYLASSFAPAGEVDAPSKTGQGDV